MSFWEREKLPGNISEFTNGVAELFRTIDPLLQVHILDDRSLVINHKRIDVQNIYRMAAADPTHSYDIALRMVRCLIGNIEDDNSIMSKSPDAIKSRIMPRIQPISIFKSLDERMVVYTPFINDTVILYVYDHVNTTTSITNEHLQKLEMSFEECDKVARLNLESFNHDAKVELIRGQYGQAAIFSANDGYDSARLLLPNLHVHMSQWFRGDFLAFIPNRDLFYMVSSDFDPNQLKKLKENIQHNYDTMPHPITKEAFLVTMDGIATGKDGLL